MDFLKAIDRITRGPASFEGNRLAVHANSLSQDPIFLRRASNEQGRTNAVARASRLRLPRKRLPCRARAAGHREDREDFRKRDVCATSLSKTRARARPRFC